VNSFPFRRRPGGAGYDFWANNRSASSRLFDLNGEAHRLRKKQSSGIIAVDVRGFGHVINKDGVLGTHNRIFLYQNGRMCPRRKARVRAPCKVTGRLTECPSVSVTALRPWRLAAPPGPWAANRPIAPHYAPSGYIRLPNSNRDPTHARGEPHD